MSYCYIVLRRLEKNRKLDSKCLNKQSLRDSNIRDSTTHRAKVMFSASPQYPWVYQDANICNDNQRSLYSKVIYLMAVCQGWINNWINADSESWNTRRHWQCRRSCGEIDGFGEVGHGNHSTGNWNDFYDTNYHLKFKFELRFLQLSHYCAGFQWQLCGNECRSDNKRGAEFRGSETMRQFSKGLLKISDLRVVNLSPHSACYLIGQSCERSRMKGRILNPNNLTHNVSNGPPRTIGEIYFFVLIRNLNK